MGPVCKAGKKKRCWGWPGLWGSAGQAGEKTEQKPHGPEAWLWSVRASFPA